MCTFSISRFFGLLDAPQIDKSPAIAKSASDKGEVALLTCKATGAPDISFMWSRMGTVIQDGDKESDSEDEEEDESKEDEDESDQEPPKYTIQSKMIDK